jgi:hypothetical protein
MIRLDIKRLVRDLGGIVVISNTLGICRTSPYRWIYEENISLKTLCRIKTAWPDLDLNHYFVEMPPWEVTQERARKAKNQARYRARERVRRKRRVRQKAWRERRKAAKLLATKLYTPQ